MLAAAAGAGLWTLAGVAPAAAGAAAVWTTATLVRRALDARRTGRERTDLVAALGMVTRDLQAGAPPVRALSAAAATGQGAARAVLEGVAATAGDVTGPGRTPSGSVRQVVGERLSACWAVSHRHGLPLARLVEALRVDLQSEVDRIEARNAEAAGPRLSGHLLAALPALGLLLGAGMGADPIRVLTATTVGQLLLVGGVLLTCVGLLWTDRLVAGPGRR
ncbi:hypothetical protein JL107_07390 [Nakamurella flavida]|uniref:Type II secretion system protein GspF domain-containing protein n=1 Tax=Nakamurella flavida TaxID=363630 RepID=A0A938YNU4_9ACTN|nr:hypothetical protein [Nakamurella flavida]MBM9476260.1 hypothetical protein [Nakamurella flavida]MDP9779642.1 tight adherence protein B [Nakamurella flavida]